MRSSKAFVLQFLILLLYSTIVFPQSDICDSRVSFGDINICMPKIAGITECYSNPMVKVYSDMFKGTDDEEILAFYMSKKEYDEIYDTFLENGIQDGYLKVYTSSLVKGVYVRKEDLNTVSNGIKSAFDDYSGSDVESLIKKRALDLNISFGKPILFEEYKLNSSTNSFVALMNLSSEGENVVMVAIMNAIIIKNRLIFVAYYDQYEGINKIGDIKSINDYFVLNLLSAN